MIYYLEDHTSGIVVAASPDPFVITNLKSGILDCHLKVSNNNDLESAVDSHTPVFTGVALQKGHAVSYKSISEFKFIKEKIALAKIRKSCFVELVTQVKLSNLKNLIGFDFGDEVYVQYALSNNDALTEYAGVTGTSEEFAKKELELISKSAIEDRFRIFTVASMIKNKINQVTTTEQATELIAYTRRVFTTAGIPNV